MVSEEEQLDELVENLYEEYQRDGFDLNTDMTFDEVFKKIFGDAVGITIDILEKAEEGDDLMDDKDSSEVA